jgi:hypothetical protein
MISKEHSQALYLRQRAQAAAKGGRPGADLGKLMFEVLNQHGEFPPFMRIIEIKPAEERRADNNTLLVTMTENHWEPQAGDDHEELSKLFLRTFDQVPQGSWVGVASSLYAVQALEPCGFVDMIRGLRTQDTLDIAACKIDRYESMPKHRAEPWLSLVLRKLSSRGQKADFQWAA